MKAELAACSVYKAGHLQHGCLETSMCGVQFEPCLKQMFGNKSEEDFTERASDGRQEIRPRQYNGFELSLWA